MSEALSTKFFIPTQTLAEVNANTTAKLDSLLSWLTKWVEFGKIKNDDPYLSVEVSPAAVTEKQNEELKTRFEVDDKTTVIQFKAKLIDAKTLLHEMTGRIQAALSSNAPKIEISETEKTALEKYHIFGSQRLRITDANEVPTDLAVQLNTIGDYKKLVASLHERLQANLAKKAEKVITRFSDDPSSGQFIMRELLLRAAVKTGFRSFPYPTTTTVKEDPSFNKRAKELGFPTGYELMFDKLFGMGGKVIHLDDIDGALGVLGIDLAPRLPKINRSSLIKEIDAEYQKWQDAFAKTQDADDKQTILDSTIFIKPVPSAESLQRGDTSGQVTTEPAAATPASAAKPNPNPPPIEPPPAAPAAKPGPKVLVSTTRSTATPAGMCPNFFASSVATEDVRARYATNLETLTSRIEADCLAAAARHPHAAIIKFTAMLVNDVLGDTTPNAIAEFAAKPKDFNISPQLINELNRAIGFDERHSRRFKTSADIPSDRKRILFQTEKIKDYIETLARQSEAPSHSPFANILLDTSRLRELANRAHLSYSIPDSAPAQPSPATTPASKPAAAETPKPAYTPPPAKPATPPPTKPTGPINGKTVAEVLGSLKGFYKDLAKAAEAVPSKAGAKGPKNYPSIVVARFLEFIASKFSEDRQKYTTEGADSLTIPKLILEEFDRARLRNNLGIHLVPLTIPKYSMADDELKYPRVHAELQRVAGFIARLEALKESPIEFKSLLTDGEALSELFVENVKPKK